MRTLFALIVAAALALCIGCGSSSSSTTSDLSGAWTANIPAQATSGTSTTTTSTSAPTQPQTQMSFNFSLAQPAPANPNGGGGGNAPATAPTPVVGNGQVLTASNLTLGSANACFDNNAVITASQTKQASGNIQVLLITLSENGNTLSLEATTSDGQTAFGTYRLTGVTAGCMSDSGSASLTRNGSQTPAPTNGGQ